MKTIKNYKTKGWAKLSPKRSERMTMLKKCGKKCFLGPNKSFPICNKGTCKINKKGINSAYVRARQWGNAKSTYKKSKPRHSRKTYKNIANKAKKMLKNVN